MAIWKFRYWFFFYSTLIRHVRISFFLFSFLGILTGLLFSCSHQDGDVLQVRHFHLQDVKPVDTGAQMARGEQLYRLRGAVTMEERRSRLGHYYTVMWKNDQAGEHGGDMKVVMEYQQAATASKVLRMSREIPGDEASGKVEFRITGEAYRVGGRVLAWRVQLLRDGKVIADEQSYLWK